MVDSLSNGKSYSFDTIHAGILGATFLGARLTGTMEYSTAKLVDPNIDNTQAALLPYLKPTDSIKHTSYTYYVFQTQTKDKLVLAREWVRMESVNEFTQDSLTIVVHGANAGNTSELRKILGLAGFNSVSIL